jgi:hypothetical protein
MAHITKKNNKLKKKMKTKQCSKCKEVKPVDGFNKDKKGRDGLRSDCKACLKQYRQDNKEVKKQYYQTNKEAYAKRGKQYYQANKEAYAKRGKQYYQANKEATAERGKQYRQANKEAIAKRMKQYYQDNKEVIAEKGKQYYQNNKDKINARSKARRATDPAYKVVCLLRRRLGHALNGTSKAASTMELVGCDRDHLLFHLESQFTDGMTWQNIHIDHIQPCSGFDLEDEEQQRVCFHYTNLQPLFCRDNLIKSDKDPGDHQVRLL